MQRIRVDHPARAAARVARYCSGALLLALSPVAQAQEGAQAQGEKVERAREVLDKWVETQRTISKEQRDWALRQQVLQERIEILERDIAAVRTKIDEAKASVATADKKRQELQERSDQLKTIADRSLGIVAKLEEGTLALIRRLPKFAEERVKLFSQRIPAPEAEKKPLLTERYQSVIAVLNDLNKFHREITLTPEIRELPDGRSAEVATVYVGLGQGYYATGDGSVAGIGSVSEGEWKWRPANPQAHEIARVIAILKNDEVADYVRLPIRID